MAETRLSQEFERTLAENTDEQLHSMLAHARDYIPEALVRIRTEMERRNLSPERVEELDRLSQAIVAEEANVAQKQLAWPSKVIIFLLSFSLIEVAVVAVIGEAYRNKGYMRKYEDCWTWMWYGLVFWILSSIVIGLCLRFSLLR
ncbi:MAG: hypothetical protein ACRD3O_01345 [Terriglobia bacterium]